MYTFNQALKEFKPFVTFNRILSRRFLRRTRLIIFYLFALSVLYVVATLTIYPSGYHDRYLGLSLILGALWLEQILLYAYSNSFYFKGLDSIIASSGKNSRGITLEVAEAILPYQNDVTKGFMQSLLGRRVVWQSGINLEELDTWLAASARTKLSSEKIQLPEDKTFTLISLAKWIEKNDVELADFLLGQGVTGATLVKTTKWIVSAHHDFKRQERWYSRDNLSRHGGLGRELAFGRPYELEKYSKPIQNLTNFSDLTSAETHYLGEIEKIENTLARSKSSNVILLGEAGVGKMDILLAVSKRLEEGRGLNALSGQHLLVIDIERLVMSNPNPTELEQALHFTLTQAANAGNCSIIINNLTDAIESTARYQVNLPMVLDEYLAIGTLHILVTDTVNNYHSVLAPLGGFVRRFEQIIVEELSDEHVLSLIEKAALNLSVRNDVYFTHKALEAILLGSKRSLQQEVLSDKALSYLEEIAVNVAANGEALVTEDHVYTYISKQTGIPMGPISKGERDQLLRIEDELHRQVIGQDTAINSIARALRRARLHMRQNERPLGSFFFLGPTGVGKTETAKALCNLLFNDETAMLRFDMSEYSQEDGLIKLIGDRGQTGLLADRVREKPYAVLLFDEFEKANRSVHDLFLQILDEGFFTDGRGERVNLRTTVIIATSNAAADLIARTTKARMDAPTIESAVIDNLIENQIFRREFINRFDDVIIFEPLNTSEYQQIAELILGSLTKAVAAKGYRLEVSPELLSKLIEQSHDERFGARSLNRSITEHIEDIITKKIIADEVSPGQTIKIDLEDYGSA